MSGECFARIERIANCLSDEYEQADVSASLQNLAGHDLSPIRYRVCSTFTDKMHSAQDLDAAPIEFFVETP